jgi:hypothetical protein
MNAHTPGPWFADPSKSFYVTAQDGTQVIASCDRQANARLIASAPGLLAALLLARDWVPSDAADNDAIQAAILKAIEG